MTNALADTSALRNRLVETLIARGALHEQRWISAFRTVPRERFVDQFTAVDAQRGQLIEHTLTRGEQTALEAIYTDSSLLTQFDAGGTASSSSTAPSLMASMLEQLDARPGHRVLEVGTGTGYNAALLSHALGSAAVTSVDIHRDLVEQAAGRLGELGFAPTVAVADGRAGAPQHGPYDRIIATCGMARVPAAWLSQLSPNAVVVLNLGFGLAVLHGGPNGLSGRFVEQAAFMSARTHATEASLTGRDVVAATSDDERETHDAPGIAPETFLNPAVAFLRTLHYPHLHYVLTSDHDGTSAYHLYDPSRQAWTRATLVGERATVATHGRDLWNELHQLVTSWNEHGRPNLNRYGLTVQPDRTHVLWLDEPDTAVAVLVEEACG